MLKPAYHPARQQKTDDRGRLLPGVPQCATWACTDGTTEGGVLNGGAGALIEWPDDASQELRAPAEAPGASSATYAAPTLQPPALQPSQSSPLVITAATEGHAQTATAAPSPATRATQRTPYAGHPSPGASLRATVSDLRSGDGRIARSAAEGRRPNVFTSRPLLIHCDRGSAPTQFVSLFRRVSIPYIRRVYISCVCRVCLFRFCV